MTHDDIEFLKALAVKAGERIMEVYESGDFSVEVKSDDSPLTIADQASHEIIATALAERFPDIPIISEEDNSTVPFDERADWKQFWLVDPLDGTKEFIQKRSDFTVNIALVSEKTSGLGVVYAPARKWLYWVGTDGKAYVSKPEDGGSTKVLPCAGSHEGVIAVRSKSHPSPSEEGVLARYGVTGEVSMGSSLKFCLVAEGAAELYYRAGPTWEWDTAAAHAVVSAAGCIVFNDNGEAGEILCYNKPTLKNDYGFLCLGEDLARDALTERSDKRD